MITQQEEIQLIRREYGDLELKKTDLLPKPIDQFQSWFSQAIEAEVIEPNAMVLATTKMNNPKARYVLFKGIDNEGLIFHTHYESAKAKEIEGNNLIAGVFYWREIHRQVRIEGVVEKSSKEISDNYFKSRPRGGQLSAIASPQSKVINSRKEIEDKIISLEKEYGESEIIRPDTWGGYTIKPNIWEFWQGRKNRTHDRFRYEENDGVWDVVRLAP
tara:strand:- start:6184 stop:6831 length:648 start_codon:yes stop_codon:yes gene_type:complete